MPIGPGGVASVEGVANDDVPAGRLASDVPAVNAPDVPLAVGQPGGSELPIDEVGVGGGVPTLVVPTVGVVEELIGTAVVGAALIPVSGCGTQRRIGVIGGRLDGWLNGSVCGLLPPGCAVLVVEPAAEGFVWLNACGASCAVRAATVHAMRTQPRLRILIATVPLSFQGSPVVVR